jgi:hypothetical protein
LETSNYNLKTGCKLGENKKTIINASWLPSVREEQLMLGGHLTVAKRIRRLKNTMLLTTTRKNIYKR